MVAKTSEFPKIRTDVPFKQKVYKACEAHDIKYSELVRTLLFHFIEGNISIDDDYSFVQSAKIALESDEVNKSVEKLFKHLKDNSSRKYQNTIKLK